ncbi:metallophosphoesterase [Rhizorhapis suberifaciens]|uniref:Serine/threonine protein phosphatase 1 n=1 Tax=Rhizorhapis suberifaciens TaxID=13656 RepID=A0A840HP30_9SPHN|nr:metallophosphoesterase [Rhizorhapis suberifaciens]MBB4639792.1 serine/threonine protein phosphatase 1 [Rhizorhapis suberifaciens]
MLGIFSRRKKIAEAPALPSVEDGRRYYAIGDIHGRLDLLDQLLDRILSDSSARGDGEARLIFLGDLVDRGPASAGVVQRAMELAELGIQSDEGTVRFLKGNHEEVFIRAARGDVQSTRFLTRFGGRETMLSYGLGADDYESMEAEQLTDWMLNNVPRVHIDFLDSFEDLIEAGDYVFVHAGIKPGVALSEQDPADLRWIRDEFLFYRQPHDKIVVHGHTIMLEVDEHPNRIGIDTGAYHSGRLTAIGLEGTERWYLSTADR